MGLAAVRSAQPARRIPRVKAVNEVTPEIAPQAASAVRDAARVCSHAARPARTKMEIFTARTVFHAEL
jgi:hypothetical protein